MKMGAWPAMAPEIVRFVGQAVAVVIAETKNQARDAAEAVVVNYEELPAAADIRAAIKPGAPQLHPEAPGNVIYDWTIGEEAATDAAFKAAANVVSLDITNNRLVPNAMEPRAAIAEYNEPEEHFTLYTTSQNPHVARLVLSAFYNIAQEHKLRVVAARGRLRLQRLMRVLPDRCFGPSQMRRRGPDATRDSRPFGGPQLPAHCITYIVHKET